MLTYIYIKKTWRSVRFLLWQCISMCAPSGITELFVNVDESLSITLQHVIFNRPFPKSLCWSLFVCIANVNKKKLSTFAMLDPLVSSNVYFSFFWGSKSPWLGKVSIHFLHVAVGRGGTFSRVCKHARGHFRAQLRRSIWVQVCPKQCLARSL